MVASSSPTIDASRRRIRPRSSSSDAVLARIMASPRERLTDIEAHTREIVTR
jgi:hypothetical protein